MLPSECWTTCLYVLTRDAAPRTPPSSQSLRQKAASRNPDEFYFAMEKARTRDGVHVGRCEWYSLSMLSREVRLSISDASQHAGKRNQISTLRRSFDS